MKTTQGKFRALVLTGAAASVLAFAGVAVAQNQNSQDQNSNDNRWPYASAHRSPVLVVVGDVACQPGDEPVGEKKNEACNASTGNGGTGAIPQNLYASQAATAQEIENIKPDIIALVGDEQYQVGQYSDFENSYEQSYGAFKFLTRPAPGNHEFYTEHGAIGVAGYGYFSYFNGVQHNADGSIMTATISGNPDTNGTFTQPVPYSDGQAGHFEQSGGLGTEANGGSVGVGDGWYSYNLGGWHLISLNIECETQPGGCSNSGAWFAAELAWLKNDLETNHSACTAAYWHQPTFSATNGISEEGITAKAFWELLYEYGADLVLNGHDHLYAHYRPLDPNGNYDPKKGIREFIVGTGGETLDPVVTTTVTAAQATNANPETNMEDPTGNVNFNALNLEAGGTGDFWGVMSLRLNQDGYEWHFKSALKDPASTSPNLSFRDDGVGTCHGPVNGGGNSQGGN